MGIWLCHTLVFIVYRTYHGFGTPKKIPLNIVNRIIWFMDTLFYYKKKYYIKNFPHLRINRTKCEKINNPVFFIEIIERRYTKQGPFLEWNLVTYLCRTLVVFFTCSHKILAIYKDKIMFPRVITHKTVFFNKEPAGLWCKKITN